MTSILQNAFKFASNLMNCTRITGGLLPSRTTPNPPSILQRCRDILWSSERSFIAREMHPNAFLRMHLQGPHRKIRPSKNPLGGAPMLKGVVLKVLIRKPKKPNSANRKCVLVRLSNGKEMTAYIPGEGHNLQEHNIVLVRVGRAQDLPGVKLKCIRGKYDLGHVIKKKQT